MVPIHIKTIIHSKGVVLKKISELGNCAPIITTLKIKIKATPSKIKTLECPFCVKGADLPTPKISINTSTTV